MDHDKVQKNRPRLLRNRSGHDIEQDDLII